MSDSLTAPRSTKVDDPLAKSGEPGRKKGRSVWSRAFRILAGFELATICLLLLFAATFFGTIEQTHVGLYQTLQKYFDMEAIFIIPELNGKIVPLPLPGTFWVCAVLCVNMTLGGLVRIRKGWKTVGVIIAHFSMIFLMVAGAVSQLSKKEGVMHVYQGDRSDYARSYTEPSIEIYPPGEKGERVKPYVVDSEHFSGLDPDERLTIRLPELPFDLLVTGFLRSSELRTTAFASMEEVRAHGKTLEEEAERWAKELAVEVETRGSLEMKTTEKGKEVIVKDPKGKLIFEGPWDTEQDKAAAPEDIRERIESMSRLESKAEEASEIHEKHQAAFAVADLVATKHGVPGIVDGFFLQERPRVQQEETNLTGCYLTAQDKEGNVLRELVLHYNGMGFPTPVTAMVEGKRYEFSLTRWIWPMPFEVELDKTMGEYWPGTQAPSWFQSDITKVDDGLRNQYSIVMNKPMRHEGITLYQASWAPPTPGGRPSSGFAIVQNPSDQWPKWSLYIASFGLMLHFGMKLTRFLGSSIPRKKKSDA